MIKTAILVPYVEMLESAKRIAQEEQMETVVVKYITSADAVREARKAVEDGAHIVIARGYQAKMIKKYTNIPMVEMRFHAQEIGILLKQAKAMIRKERPRIGMVVYENMLSDMSHMEELFNVDLSVIYLGESEDMAAGLKDLVKEQVDIVIGGESVCREAEKMGYPTLFYTATDESIREAIQSAKRMAYAAEVEMQSAAQFETILDTSFNGIIKINTNRQIITINRRIENILGKNISEVVGLKLEEAFPVFDIEAVDSILKGKRENYSTSVNLRDRAWMLMMAPIQYDSHITGGILSLQKISEIAVRENPLRNPYLHGFMTNMTFQKIKTRSQKMKETLQQAENYALADSAILMYAGEGLECFEIAEAIHNNSRWKSGPYLSVDVSVFPEEKQMEILFGNPDSGEKGILRRAEGGTVFITGADHFCPAVQERLRRSLRSDLVMRTDGLPFERYNVRLILLAEQKLSVLATRGLFDKGLYYYLQSLVIKIPDLHERREDLLDYFQRYFKEFMQKYNKHLALTKGAVEKICQLSWPGNRIQLKSFCERLVLDSQKRNIDEVKIQNLYEELFPLVLERASDSQVVVYQSPEAVQLCGVLEKCHGSRSLAAKELGISTTTLWRKMKKYGIEANYGKL